MPDRITASIVQYAPVFLNLPASLDRLEDGVRKAAADGSVLIATAECWLPGYPVWLDFAPDAALWNNDGAQALFTALAGNAVTRGDQHLTRLQALSDETGAVLVIGTHERDGKTLYNTSFTFVPGGQAGLPHRKLVPTYTERLVWGRGDGSTLVSADSPIGRIGNLICWEHWMPLARAAMHAAGEDCHVAQWPVVKDMHLVASRHYAFEGGTPVIAAGSYMRKSDVVDGYRSLGTPATAGEALLESITVNGVGEPDAVIHAGGSTIIGADGDILSEPVSNREAIVSAEIDMTLAQTQALTLDTDGHYSRPDIFELHVDTAPRHGVVFSSVDTKQV